MRHVSIQHPTLSLAETLMPRLSKSFMALWALNMLQTLAAISIKFNYSIAKVVSLMTEKCRLNQISDLFLKIELFTEKLLA